jgi:hypothetical protein
MADVAQAQKVAPITAVVGGYHEQTFGYASNEDNVLGGNLTAANSKPTGFQQKSDSEIWFGGRTTLANGITIGFDVQLEANSRASDQIDESYLFVDGAFGRFVMGSENAADYIMHYAAPGAGKAYGPLESSAVDWITRPANVVFLDTTAGKLVDATSASDTGSTNGGLSTGIGNDQQRITYYTPRFFGFQGGISFTPSNGEDTTAFAPVDKNTVRTYAWHGAVNYVNTFGGFMVAASAGISYWPGVDGTPGAAGVTAAAAEDIIDYQFGLNVGYAGFVVGGAYRRYDAGDVSINDGWAANIGVTYTTGPFAIGLSYHHSNTEGSTSTDGSDKVDQVLASAAYTLGPGVDLIGSLFWIKYNDETGDDANNNEGVGLIGGVRLSF